MSHCHKLQPNAFCLSCTGTIFIIYSRNGGGAFLIPFAIMMCIIGVPLFFMEASLGQFSSKGPMTCWGFAPVFKGIYNYRHTWYFEWNL